MLNTDLKITGIRGRATGATLGFTVTELVVVVALAGVLMALLLPVFARGRDDARIRVCASNLHQIALALHQYANDYDGVYPPNNTYALRERHRLAWDLLMPYVHDSRVFHCPDETGVFGKALGYDYRVALWNDPSVLLQKPLRPDAGTVVAICEQHTERSGEDGWIMNASGHAIGPLIVAREDGSVSRVMADQVEFWAYQSGQWSRLSRMGCPAKAALCMARFPGEQWPPQL